MKKLKKISLIVVSVLVSLILLDTLQARLLKQSPFISWQEKINEDSYVDKGIILNTYYCVKDTDIVTVSWHFSNTKFTCPEYDNNEHTFLGIVTEVNKTHLMVEPYAYEEELYSSDKFLIELDNYNNTNYEVETIVKITYKGMIYESYPAQIDTTKIEIKTLDNFKLIFQEKNKNTKKQIIDKKTSKQYDYNIYTYNGEVEIVVDNQKYSLENALKSNKITMNEILAKAIKDFPNAASYDDGGSIEYHYDNYTILKLHTIDGNKDVYIGNKDFTIHDIEH